MLVPIPKCGDTYSEVTCSNQGVAAGPTNAHAHLCRKATVVSAADPKQSEVMVKANRGINFGKSRFFETEVRPNDEADGSASVGCYVGIVGEDKLDDIIADSAAGSYPEASAAVKEGEFSEHGALKLKLEKERIVPIQHIVGEVQSNRSVLRAALQNPAIALGFNTDDMCTETTKA